MTTNTPAIRSALPVGTQLDYLIIDGSGSMADKWNSTLATIDAFLSTIRDAGVPSHILLSTFDSYNVSCIHRDAALDACPLMAQAPIASRWGDTPLYDAINAAGWALRDLSPARAHICFITDGRENASKATDVTQARALLAWMRARGWQVTFIGCDFNNSSQARELGLDASNAIGVQRGRLKEAGKLLATKRIGYARFGTDMNFSEDEQQQFGGYLAAPES